MSLGNIGSKIAGSFSSDNRQRHPDLNNHSNDFPNDKDTIAINSADPENALATNLQSVSAAGDDRNLASHGDKKYWYSIGDGYRLLLAIRKNKLTYTNAVVGGEDYSAHRENAQRILITDPYYLANFAVYLSDDIKRITDTHETPALNTCWTQPPQLIIIPVLTGCHWRCIRVELDYVNKKIHILFDDPYGQHRFDDTLKATLKKALIQQLSPLFGTIGTDIADRFPLLACEEKDKEINQQGAGNGYDCGPIVFGNIADYADVGKDHQALSQGKGLHITESSNDAHEELMIGIRTSHMHDYAQMSGVSIDETRLAEIRSAMQKAHQAKLATMREHDEIDDDLHHKIVNLPAEYISIILNAVGELGISIRQAYEGLQAEKIKDTTFLKTHEQNALYSVPTLMSYIPSSLGSRYVPRTAEIDQIEQILATCSYAIISGEPGLGKTALAIEYGHKQMNLPEPVTVIKIDADSPEKINAEYKRMALALAIPIEQQNITMVIRLVNNKFRYQKKVLFILDNVEAYDDIKPYLDHLPANIKALITTRDHHLITGASFIKAKPFTYAEAEQYIQSSAIKHRTKLGTEEIQALLTYYAKGTDYIAPHYLNRAIAIIQFSPDSDITAYLKNIEKYGDDEGEIVLLQKHLVQSKLAWPMLQYAAFLDPDAIDLQIFKQLFDTNEDAVEQAVKMLNTLYMMTINWKDGQAYLSLHRLTQRIIKKFIDNPAHQAECMGQTKILLQLVKSLHALCPTIEDNPKNWPQVKKLMPHIEHVLNQLPDTAVSVQIAELWMKAGDYTQKILGLYSQSLTFYQKALAMWQSLYGEQPHPDFASCLNNAGHAYHNLGGVDNIKQAVVLKERALTMRQTLYGNQPHPDVATSLNVLGISYENLNGIDNVRKGLEYQEQALIMRQTLYGKQPHKDVATSLDNVGISYQNLGGVDNVRKGLLYQEQALIMRQVLYSNQPHPHLACSLSNRGIYYYRLGGVNNIRKALEYFKQALIIRKNLYGDQPHPDLARLLNHIGCTYEALGGADNIREGLVFRKQALVMNQVLYGDQPHLQVVKTLNGIGIAYQKLGGAKNIEKGLGYQGQASAMHKKLYPNAETESFCRIS